MSSVDDLVEVDDEDLDLSEGFYEEDDKQVPDEVVSPVTEEVTLDLSSGLSTEEQDYQDSSENILKTRNNVVEVDDSDLDLSGGLSVEEDIYKDSTEDTLEDLKEVIEKQNEIISKNADSMQKMQDSIAKIAEAQTDILSKNADSFQSMQDSMTSTIQAQAQLVQSVSMAIDSRVNSSNAIEKIDDRKALPVSEPYPLDKEVVTIEDAQVIYDDVVLNKKKRTKKRLVKSCIKWAVIIGVLLALWSNGFIRGKILTIGSDIKEIAQDVRNDNKVSFDKLLQDLGVKGVSKVNE